MKKMKKIVILSLSLLIAVSCQDLTDFNKDIKNPETVPSGALFANATVVLVNFMTSANVNINNFRLWAQQWAQTTYADESNFELVERNVPGSAWNTLYATVIRDLDDAKKFIELDLNLSPAAKANQLAMCEVLQVFSYHVLVDIFGDIPYTEALTADVTPAYDDDEDIYADLVARLTLAIADLGGDSRMGASDLIYGGDGNQWKKFANSLKLRLAMRMADVPGTSSKAIAEAAVASGVFTANDDNFALVYETTTPNTNPLWVDLVQSGRSDFVAAKTLVDFMADRDDPRLAFYYKDTFDGEYLGGTPGDNNSYNQFSHPGFLQLDPTFPGILLSYWEVAFLLADAAARGYTVGGTAESFYNKGIEASILYWGGSADDVTDYLANTNVAYGTAPGTAKEKIALQKYISLYDQGFEAWSSYRLYDHPFLPKAVQADAFPPTRYTYPVTEYSLNEESVKSASTAIGGDDKYSKVFWDVN
jgi:hypothetical protein